MLQLDNHIQISGSERIVLPNARKIGLTEPNEQVSVTLVVRRKGTDKELTTVMNVRRFSLKYFTREEFAEDFHIHTDDMKRIYDFAIDYGLVVGKVLESAGIIVLSGLVENLNKAFNVELANYKHQNFYYRGRTGYVHIPKRISGIVQAVLGLDNRPQSKPHFRLLKENEILMQRSKLETSFTPLEVAKLYNFPENIDCSDQCIGIIELGGGYRPSDLEAYFSKVGNPAPQIIDVEVDGAKNTPSGYPNGPDGEVALDIEIAAAVAPGAKIAVYFAPNSDEGFLNAITTAIHDKLNKPSVISISWGAPESQWTKQAMLAMNQVFKDAEALGVTICCASGDNGSNDGVEDGFAHVDFPASSPYVLACGGTRLEGTNGVITNEVVWNEMGNGATGGGYSSIFDLPSWQSNVGVPTTAIKGEKRRRGVPDIAGNADPATGYQILVDGQQLIFGGTSAVAPLYAGLFAIINQQLGQSIGFLNPLLYQLSSPESGLHDITSGNNDTIGNGSFEARVGWDACTGLGSVDGTKLLNILKSYFSSDVLVN
jgi:kumamolisin